VSKNCQAHEKHWRDFCVDKNLEERWLEDLNELNVFQLISICEGHYAQLKNPSGKFPHINLKLKEKLLPGLVKDWETLRPKVLNEFYRLFQKGATYFNLDLCFKLRAGRSRLTYQEELTLKMRGFQARGSVELDPESYQWFEHSVESIKALDKIILDWVPTQGN